MHCIWQSPAGYLHNWHCRHAGIRWLRTRLLRYTMPKRCTQMHTHSFNQWQKHIYTKKNVSASQPWSSAAFGLSYIRSEYRPRCSAWFPDLNIHLISKCSCLLEYRRKLRVCVISHSVYRTINWSYIRKSLYCIMSVLGRWRAQETPIIRADIFASDCSVTIKSNLLMLFSKLLHLTWHLWTLLL